MSEILLDRKAAMVASVTVHVTVAVNLMMGQKKSRVDINPFFCCCLMTGQESGDGGEHDG